MRKIVLISSLVAASIALGFFQEQLKISINYILESAPQIQGFYSLDEHQKHDAIEAQRLVAPFDYYHSHETLRVLYKLDQSDLIRLKWVVTFSSLVIFFVLNASLLHLLQPSAHAWKTLALTYGVFTILAFGIFAIGKWMGNPEQTYAISRRITGALQSPIPAMILWPFMRIQKTT
ncbi:MAG: hypothetical protein ACK478_11100 [Flavobacteriales bacterium]|jgi:hypothetical protein